MDSTFPGRTEHPQQCSACGGWCPRAVNVCPTCNPPVSSGLAYLQTPSPVARPWGFTDVVATAYDEQGPGKNPSWEVQIPGVIWCHYQAGPDLFVLARVVAELDPRAKWAGLKSLRACGFQGKLDSAPSPLYVPLVGVLIHPAADSTPLCPTFDLWVKGERRVVGETLTVVERVAAAVRGEGGALGEPEEVGAAIRARLQAEELALYPFEITLPLAGAEDLAYRGVCFPGVPLLPSDRGSRKPTFFRTYYVRQDGTGALFQRQRGDLARVKNPYTLALLREALGLG